MSHIAGHDCIFIVFFSKESTEYLQFKYYFRFISLPQHFGNIFPNEPCLANLEAFHRVQPVFPIKTAEDINLTAKLDCADSRPRAGHRSHDLPFSKDWIEALYCIQKLLGQNILIRQFTNTDIFLRCVIVVTAQHSLQLSKRRTLGIVPWETYPGSVPLETYPWRRTWGYLSWGYI